MTRKDFEFIALVLNQQLHRINDMPEDGHLPNGLRKDAARAEWFRIRDAFTASLASQNPRFDAERFNNATVRA